MIEKISSYFIPGLSSAPFTFLGGLQHLSLLCPQPILLRGLPDSASQLGGPQRSLPSEPRCPLGARRPGQPARP